MAIGIPGTNDEGRMVIRWWWGSPDAMQRITDSEEARFARYRLDRMHERAIHNLRLQTIAAMEKIAVYFEKSS